MKDNKNNWALLIGIDHYPGGNKFPKLEAKQDPHGSGEVNRSFTLVIDSAQTKELDQALDKIYCSICDNPNLSEKQKSDIVDDLSTIHAQITKGKPSAGIVKAAWASFKKLTASTEAIDAARKVEYLLKGFL